MAYVPGFDYDLFFSYARDDSPEWVHALEESLRQDLIDRLGPDVAIWRDKDNIRFGQNWREEIGDAVKASAALLAIMSPSYQLSSWCRRECQTFVDHAQAGNRYKVGRYYRFLKLVRLPWPDNAHEGFFPELQHVGFFRQMRGGEEEIEFTPGTDEFRAKVREAGQAIKCLLLEMRRGREAVFIAGSTDDTLKAAGELRRELRAQAFNARPDGSLYGYSDDLIEKEMQSAVLSVHFLGSNYDPSAGKLIDLAIKLGKRLVLWPTPQGEGTQDTWRKKLIERKLENKPLVKWDLLDTGSSRDRIQAILGILRDKPAATPAATNGQAPRVYLLCDPTTAEDAVRAREIRAQISDKANMQVDLPSITALGAVVPTDHQKMLRECDGLLLYRNAAPKKWLFETYNDVLFAEDLVDRPTPVRSKAFLLNDPALLSGKIAGVPIIPQTGEFRLSDLEPFLAPLRKGDAHAAG
jgi:TIR domain